jgi:hypothetical protein
MSENTNKFKFKKGEIEFEFEGEKSFVESQIKEWKSEINNLLKSENNIKVEENTNTIFETKTSLPFSISSLDFTSKIEEVEKSIQKEQEENISFEIEPEKEENKSVLSLNDIVSSMSTREIKVSKKITFDDFIELKNPENDDDRVMSAAYFLEKYDKQSNFNELDIYRLLSLENSERFILSNVEKGYLIGDQKTGSINNYTITYTGENYVKEGFEI